MNIDIGIKKKTRSEISEGLSKVLADSYSLYLMTHNYHWNVTGPMFRTLHLMFEEQYTELAEAVDEIAERIRALGFPAPGTFKQFEELSVITIKEGIPNPNEMIRNLCEGNEIVARTSRAAFSIADEANDEPTCDLLTARMEVHEKAAWMLRSMLE